MLSCSKNIYASQSKFCWLFVHIRFTCWYFHAPRWWPWCLRVGIAAPKHNPATGYHLTHWYLHWGRQ